MPRAKELFIFDDKRQIVAARYHDLTPKGKPVIRRDLCTYEEYDFKSTSKGRKKRSEVEKKNFLLTRLQEVSELMKQELQSKEEKHQSPLIKKIMQEWLDYLASLKKSPNTISAYANATNYYLKGVGNHPIQEFKRHYNGDLLRFFTKKGFNPRTQRKHVTALNGFFSWAYDGDYYEGKQIKLTSPPVTKKDPRNYSHQDIQSMENSIWNKYSKEKSEYRRFCYWSHLRVLIMLRETGLRRSECWALRLDNILLNQRYILIRDNEELGVVVKSKEEQSVPISERLASFLKQDLENRNSSEIYYLDSGNGLPHFSSSDKLTQCIQRHRKSLGISGAKVLHGFRSTLITDVVSKHGVAMGQTIARHGQITTTMLYVNKAQLSAKEALDSLQVLPELTMNKQ